MNDASLEPVEDPRSRNRNIIEAFLHLDHKLVLALTGFREGHLFGGFVDQTMSNQLLLTRVSVWPGLQVECSLDYGRSWELLSDEESTIILHRLSCVY